MKFSYPVRIDRFLGNAGYGSRKDIKAAIKAGLVKINGEVVQDAGQKVHENDQVHFGDVLVSGYRHYYFVFHKPAGYVCSNEDPIQPTIFLFINHKIRSQLQIVGRLDKDVTGLVILTTDGQFNHKITSPKKIVPKFYQITLAEPLTEKQIRKLREGIKLEKDFVTSVLDIYPVGENTYEMVLHHGKYHIVKKMLEKIEADLLHLHRVQIGGFRLPEDLEEKQYRELSEKEKELLTLSWEEVSKH